MRETLQFRKLNTMSARLGYKDPHLEVSKQIRDDNSAFPYTIVMHQNDVLREVIKQTEILREIAKALWTK